MNRNAKKSLFNDSSTQQTSSCFWEICKPLFSAKANVTKERLQLIENGDVISDDCQVSKIFNEYFNKITDGLDIPE